MNISIVGTGYVALVTASCFAELGVNVTCVDPENQKINRLIYGALPIYEPGLEDMMNRNVNEHRLTFSSDFHKGFEGVSVVFCAVDSTLTADGTTDLEPILNIARVFGQHITETTLFVIKTTVPVGTAAKVKEIIAEEITKRKADVIFDVASNPDFLTEGNGIKDFMRPDRIVIGTDTEESRDMITRLYRPILHHRNSVIFTDTRTAEMIKYAATSMLATRISLMNEIANMCEVVGADANVVRHGVGTDSRIGPKYIYPGCGYGGTLFSQDIRDLIKLADDSNFTMDVLRAVDSVNVNQKRILFKKLEREFNGDLKDKTIALWGLSFKPETDDMREGPSIDTLNLLTEAGCKIRVYDPVAMNTAKMKWSEIYTAVDMYDAVSGADALLLLTEWRQFHLPSWNRVRQLMKNPLVIDGRNIWDVKELTRKGLTYRCIGR